MECADISGNIVISVENQNQIEINQRKEHTPSWVWPGLELPINAPPPSEIPTYTIKFFNDMGHLGYEVTPDAMEYWMFLKCIECYTSRDMYNVWKHVNDYILTFIKIREGVPMIRNVSAKYKDEWITVCLDYTDLDHTVQDS
jgi:hypothetical protein